MLGKVDKGNRQTRRVPSEEAMALVGWWAGLGIRGVGNRGSGVDAEARD